MNVKFTSAIKNKEKIFGCKTLQFYKQKNDQSIFNSGIYAF